MNDVFVGAALAVVATSVLIIFGLFGSPRRLTFSANDCSLAYKSNAYSLDDIDSITNQGNWRLAGGRSDVVRLYIIRIKGGVQVSVYSYFKRRYATCEKIEAIYSRRLADRCCSTLQKDGKCVVAGVRFTKNTIEWRDTSLKLVKAEVSVDGHNLRIVSENIRLILNLNVTPDSMALIYVLRTIMGGTLRQHGTWQAG